jgi:hypothetical protein
LIKNREYASQSRSRKKVFVDDLQKKFEEIQQENMLLKRQVHVVTEENIMLKKQINAIAASIKRSSTPVPPPTVPQTMMMMGRNFPPNMFTIGRVANVKTAACLLVCNPFLFYSFIYYFFFFVNFVI